MRRSWAAVALVIAALLMSAAGSPLASQTSARVRRIAYAPNLPLAARLLPDDVTVVVEPIGKGEEVVYEHQPTQRQVALELLGSTAAFVMRVSAAESSLMDEGRWISTTVTGTITEILRVPIDKARAFTAGRTLSVEMFGGRLRIGHVVVETEGAAVVEPGRRYVVFAGNGYSSPELPFLRHVPLRLNASGSLHPTAGGGSELDGMSMRRLRSLARSDQ